MRRFYMQTCLWLLVFSLLFCSFCTIRKQAQLIQDSVFWQHSYKYGSSSKASPNSSLVHSKAASRLPSTLIHSYVDSIFGDQNDEVDNLQCPPLNETRYASLFRPVKVDNNVKFYFALDLRNSINPLPRLLASIVEVAQFLGTENCAVSIVEGLSEDGTREVLEALKPKLKAIDLRYILHQSSVDSTQGNRIDKLANLRNIALEPLTSGKVQGHKDAEVIFLNDIAACPEDLLELILQRQNLGADMTCAMDWTYVGPDPTFYDVWVSRSIHGEIFFDIPPDNSWDNAWNLFWNDDPSQARYVANRPFQVFSCWNGATVFRAQPFLDGLQFRGPTDSECFQGEAELICKDLWLRGHGKIAVVPSVNLEYTVERGRQIKQLKGYTSDIVSIQDSSEDSISWQLEPPEMVKCMPDFKRQSWRPWNEGFEQGV